MNHSSNSLGETFLQKGNNISDANTNPVRKKTRNTLKIWLDIGKNVNLYENYKIRWITACLKRDQHTKFNIPRRRYMASDSALRGAADSSLLLLEDLF